MFFAEPGSTILVVMKVSRAAIILFCLSGAEPAVADPLRVEEVAAGIFVHAGLPEYAERSNRGDVANMAFVVGTQAVAVIDTGNTPALGRDLREAIRQRTDLPIRVVINTHMHPDHVFGNGAFLDDRPDFVAHANFQGALMARADTYQRRLEEEFGEEAAARAVLVPPTVTVEATHRIDLGGRTLELTAHPTGHTNNDLTVFDSATGTLFAGDLVESKAALYTGDAYHFDWAGKTLDNVKAYQAENLIGGRGAVSRGVAETDAAVEQTRKFLNGMIENVGRVHKAGGTLKAAFEATRDALAPEFGAWPIFEHCLPFDVQRLWDEFEGIEHPRIWTAERDREVWAQLQG